MKNGQKFGREERMQEDYPTSAVYFLQILGNLLVLFHLCLVSVPFSGPSLTKTKFHRTFFPYSQADFGKNRALFHKRVKFGTVVENGTRNDFGYGPAHQKSFVGCDTYY